jgi:NitT/TauT family transport system substrate-binding protein
MVLGSRVRVGTVGLVVALLALLTGCGQGAGNDATTTSDAAPTTSAPDAPSTTTGDAGPSTTAGSDDSLGEPESDSLTIAFAHPEFDYTDTLEIKFLELLSEKLEPFDVTIEEIMAPDTDQAMRTVVASQADLCSGCLGSAVALVDETDEEAKVIVAHAQASSYLLLSRPEIETVEDLVGGTLGINQPGDFGDVVSRSSLTALGFDPDADFNWEQIGGTSARIAGLVAGHIDAGAAHVAEAYAAVQEAGLNPLINTGEVIGPWLQSGIVAMDAWIDENPVLAQYVVDAMIDTTRWAADNKEEWIELTKGNVPDMSDEARSDAYDALMEAEFFALNGGLSEERLARYLEVQIQSGAFGEEVASPDEWADATFVEDYLARNGDRPQGLP